MGPSDTWRGRLRRLFPHQLPGRQRHKSGRLGPIGQTLGPGHLVAQQYPYRHHGQCPARHQRK